MQNLNLVLSLSIVYLRLHDIRIIKKLKWYMNHAFGSLKEFNVKGFIKMYIKGK